MFYFILYLFKSLHSRHCTLWKADRSPACRSVMMALDAMDISLTEVDLNMDKAEHTVSDIAAVNIFCTKT